MRDSCESMSWLPHVNGILNGLVVFFIIAAYAAVRTGRRDLHARLMKAGFAAGVLFLAGYVTAVLSFGHGRFPGDDWVRTAFLVILISHTILAVAAGPLVTVMLVLGLRGKFETHRKLGRFVFPLWLYVAVTGLAIYWMNNFLRPR